MDRQVVGLLGWCPKASRQTRIQASMWVTGGNFPLGVGLAAQQERGGVENNTSLLVMMLKNEDAGEGRRKDRDRKEKLRAR